MSNGAAVVDAATGTIWFLYRRSSVSPEAFWTYAVASSDLGATWTEPRNVGLNTTGTSPGQGTGVQLGSGRLVVSNNGGGVLYSDTHGETWHDGSNWKPPSVRADYGETQIALLSDQKTILNIGHGDRTKERYQMFSASSVRTHDRRARNALTRSQLWRMTLGRRSAYSSSLLAFTIAVAGWRPELGADLPSA